MYYIKIAAHFVVICMCAVRFGVAEILPPGYKLEYSNFTADALQFKVSSEHDRYSIEAIQCGSSVYNAKSGSIKETALITGLAPCKNYQCTIDVRNENTNVKLTQNINVTTAFRSIIPPIRLSQIVEKSTLIEILLHYNQIDCIDSFYIVLDDSKVMFWTKHNLTKSLEITDLSPCVEYDIYTFFNYQSNPYKIIRDKIQTRPLKLGRVENIEFNSETGLLTWSPIFFDDCHPAKYAISIISDTADEIFLNETETNQYSVNFLSCCSKYDITIKPKGYDDLAGIIRIQTRNISFNNISIQNVEMINASALSIKWGRSINNSACNTNYALRINEVWTVINSFEHIASVCNNLQFFHISLCEVQRRSADNCVKYNFSANLNELTGPLNQSADSIPIPPLHRLNDWGSIVTNDLTGNGIVLRIKDEIVTSLNTNFTLTISELTCEMNLVSYPKTITTNIGDDNCDYLMRMPCAKYCDFNQIPEEILINAIDENLISCSSTNNKHKIFVKRGVAYRIMARIFTSSGYVDTDLIEFRTDPEYTNAANNILYISIPLVFVVLTIVVVGAIFSYRRGQTATKPNPEPEQDEVSEAIIDYVVVRNSEVEPIDLSLYKDLINF